MRQTSLFHDLRVLSIGRVLHTLGAARSAAPRVCYTLPIMTPQPKFLAVGDTVNDAFIRITDASVHCRVDKNECELCLRYSEKVPFESVTQVDGVGNSPNASVSAGRLGLNSYLVSALGNDYQGDLALTALKKNTVSLEYIARSDTPTNFHYVLWFGNDRTILVKHEKHLYHLPTSLAVDWIYLSSLGGHLEYIHDEIAEYLTKNPNTKMTFQPGTFQMKLGTEKLKNIYQKTELFVCNVEEAEQILDHEGAVLHRDQSPHTRHTPEFETHVVEMMHKFHALGAKLVSVSDGPNGAFASDGTTAYYLPIYPDPKEPLERTGCGDAFASTFSSYLALGYSFEESFRRAPINSMNVVQHIGAQEGLLSFEQIEEFLKNAPEGYDIKKL